MRLALGCLLCVPSILISQSISVSRHQQELRLSPRGMLVVLVDEGSSMAQEFRKLLQEEDLAELRLYMRVVEDNGRQKELADYLRRRYSWNNGSYWGFFDPNERCLVQGQAVPGANYLAERLSEAGIESPVRRLRAFVRQYPEHLDGRLALLRTLRSIAEERTRSVFEVESSGAGQSGRGMPRGGSRRTARLLNQAEAVASGAQPTQLSAEDDLRIWVRWADELDRLFYSGQWLESNFAFERADEFLERHSQIVRNVYKKHIAAVEDALRRWPGSERIWGIWLQMSLVLGDRPLKTLMNTLVPMPDTVTGTWPPYEAKLILIQEARKNNDWRDLRGMLWESWEQLRQLLSTFQGETRAAAVSSRVMPRMLESQWQQLLEPLLESLLMTGDIGGADSVVYHLKGTAGWDEISDLVAAVAIRCQMQQVAARWAN